MVSSKRTLSLLPSFSLLSLIHSIKSIHIITANNAPVGQPWTPAQGSPTHWEAAAPHSVSLTHFHHCFFPACPAHALGLVALCCTQTAHCRRLCLCVCVCFLLLSQKMGGITWHRDSGGKQVHTELNNAPAAPHVVMCLMLRVRAVGQQQTDAHHTCHASYK